MCSIWRRLIVLTFVVAVAPASASAVDTLVVCPRAFRDALSPWIAFRSAEGHTIGVISNEGTPAAIRSAIQQAAADYGLRAVLLVGSARPARDDAQLRARTVPVHYEPSHVIQHFGGEATIAADNYYADLDGDGLPDVAIGRLTADTPAELSAMVGRIIAYERAADQGSWRRQINLVSGDGGFGMMTDALLENAARYLLATGVPAGYQTSMTYASWQSPYCPDPRQFGSTALGRINEGCLFWVYLGHGRLRELGRISVPDGSYPILGAGDVRRICCQRGAPVALLFCCYTGAFDQPQRCLAEEMLRQDAGPVAVLAGSRVTMPYGMAVLATEMLGECFDQHRATLGEIVLHAKRNMAGDGAGSPRRQLIDALAAVASPNRDDLPAERREHVQLFNLLGDPLLKIRYPQPILLSGPKKAAAGSRIELVGRSPVAGRCTIELVVRRDRLTFAPETRWKFDDSDAALVRFQDVYRRANDSQLSHLELKLPQGEFRATLDVPAGAEGPCHVRAFVAGEKSFALGAIDMEVTAAEAKSELTTNPRLAAELARRSSPAAATKAGLTTETQMHRE